MKYRQAGRPSTFYIEKSNKILEGENNTEQGNLKWDAGLFWGWDDDAPLHYHQCPKIGKNLKIPSAIAIASFDLMNLFRIKYNIDKLDHLTVIWICNKTRDSDSDTV